MTAICATTANLPGFSIKVALDMIHNGLYEPLWGVLSSKHIQLCPQNRGMIHNEFCEKIQEMYPNTHFRLHANAHVVSKRYILDASTFSKEHLFYYQALAERNQKLNAPAYSLHAGYREHCSLQTMFESVKKIQELFGDIPVAIEGLYPDTKRPQLIDCWQEYEILLNSNHYFALDLSHLNIVAQTEGWQPDLLKALLLSDKCLEIHVSGNNGKRDAHLKLEQTRLPKWMNLFQTQINKNAIVFSEGRLI